MQLRKHVFQKTAKYKVKRIFSVSKSAIHIPQNLRRLQFSKGRRFVLSFFQRGTGANGGSGPPPKCTAKCAVSALFWKSRIFDWPIWNTVLRREETRGDKPVLWGPPRTSFCAVRHSKPPPKYCKVGQRKTRSLRPPPLQEVVGVSNLGRRGEGSYSVSSSAVPVSTLAPASCPPRAAAVGALCLCCLRSDVMEAAEYLPLPCRSSASRMRRMHIRLPHEHVCVC